ncbi:MAG: LytTR family transcriptional regulator [Bacteroidales bacterium]|nr:LytTR family transcriptional regulator [Bacteroidales bacterium]
MKEYLILGNTRQIHRIDTSDICYIRAKGNSSIVYLAHGRYFEVSMQIGKIDDAIHEYLPYSKKDFIFIGRSFIVNKKNLSYINVSDQKLEFFGKRTEEYLKGYSDGYAAGHSDGLKNISTCMPPDTMVLEQDDQTHLSKDDLKDLLNSIKENMKVKSNEK